MCSCILIEQELINPSRSYLRPVMTGINWISYISSLSVLRSHWASKSLGSFKNMGALAPFRKILIPLLLEYGLGISVFVATAAKSGSCSSGETVHQCTMVGWQDTVIHLNVRYLYIKVGKMMGFLGAPVNL